jgi:(2S)-methylsuccinyl-CoA dehydrogenase
MTGLMKECGAVLAAAETLLAEARAALSRDLAPDGRLDAAALEAGQFGAHGLAWVATYVEALRQALRWAERLEGAGRFGPTESAILALGFAEYGGQVAGGIPMSQVEFARPADMGVPPAAEAALRAALAPLATPERLAQGRATLLDALEAEAFGDVGVTDPEMALLRESFARFAAAEVTPHAQGWHDANALIPLDLIGKLAELGTFGVTIAEAHGGLGLGKVAMCLVSEMLSEGYVGVGSLGTRSEIAGELIGLNGTEAQKARWLPGIASGEILVTAVFTEPNTGSDLANLRTRAVRDGDVYRVHGAKTWITHGSRSDAMTLLARTSDAPGHKGLSMFIAPKPRGTEDNPFPAPGMSGSEIHVLGYRGMREYEIGFDGFEIAAENLLGGVEGQGFRQLMETFESARIQTAARALGVAQNADTVRQADPRLPPRAREARDDGCRDDVRATAHLFRRAGEGRGTALRRGGRHGQAARRPRRLVECGRRAADPRRQRLCAGIPDQPRAVRRAGAVHLRGRGRDPGAHHRPRAARPGELTLPPMRGRENE